MQTTEPFTSTIMEELDRLEVLAGKIGMNKSAQAMSLLQRLDAAYARIQELDPASQSRMLAETQFEGIMAKLRAETPQFLRDLGGGQVLREEREKRNPPQDREWWYLDIDLAEKRRAGLKRGLTIGGILLVVLTILTVLYNNFLAPDPVTAAIYGHENAARDYMVNGDLEAANAEVDQALALNPQEPGMLILKGVIQEGLGNQAAAEQAFNQSEQIYANRETFLVTRGQAYLYQNEFEKALADGREAVQINPDSPHGHLLAGQSNEMLANYGEAMDGYNLAFEAAEKTNQYELAAISRARLAMLMQIMNTQITPPPALLTETP